MTIEDRRDALAREFARRGVRTFTREQYTRQGMLDALRENRRRNANEPHVQALGHFARTLADDLADVLDLSPADIATVLLVAGGAGGVLAELHGLRGPTLAGVIQYAADELDQRATGGERP